MRIFLMNLLLFTAGLTAFAQTPNADCMMCHSDTELTGVQGGRTISMYISPNELRGTVHQNVRCAQCHTDAGEEIPHAETLRKVNCGSCHSKAQRNYNNGSHGIANRKGNIHAPDCKECHGTHKIISAQNPKAPTYKMNIPILCGKCHREDAPVARMYDVKQHNILENYSQSIHGKGLFEKGLLVSATCNDCHGNHMTLPHTNPWSSISPGRIAETCMNCHVQIEQVHKQVIRGELWEKKPGAIPACSDCHKSHTISKGSVELTLSDRSCLECHAEDDVHKTENGEKISLKVDANVIGNSAHKNISCVKCHTDVTPDHEERPCISAEKPDCSNCHSDISQFYLASSHGTAHLDNDPNAPYCVDCHGGHDVLEVSDPESKAYRGNIPQLCGDCHSDDTDMPEEKTSYKDYSQSVHGKGLTSKGLLVSAVCTDCHTTHFILNSEDERSSTNHFNVATTCASCHKGIYDVYIKSEHAVSKESDLKYPTCDNCHTSHTITEISSDEFMYQIMHQCRECHVDLADSYLETYHGKAYLLGSNNAARCSDCHGSHNIYGMEHPESTVHFDNIIETCKQCHTNANEKFTGYLTHATHYNKKKFPALYYTYWAMTGLLIAVFTFFGIHTLLWIPRSIRERRKNKKAGIKTSGRIKYIKRFEKAQIITHLFVIVSFLSLAVTGMILKFAHTEWAQTIVKIFGSVENAGVIHRLGATITFGYFIYHIIHLLKLRKQKGLSFKSFFFGKDSLVPTGKDFKDFWATVKWFVGAGPKPAYGRWTYWEKFDYMAVFWGVAVIGFTGLMLWFPELFSLVFPGKFINVAQIIHSDEALMAVGFIFTVHFFNTHLRPDAFPMDTVIFTGHMPLEKFKEERPEEYNELKESGKLEELTKEKEFSKLRMQVIRAAGFTFVAIGLITVALIVYSLFIL